MGRAGSDVNQSSGGGAVAPVGGVEAAGGGGSRFGTGSTALATALLVGCVVAVVAGELRLVPPAVDLSDAAAALVRVAGVAALALGAALLWRRPWARRGERQGGTGARTAAVRRALTIVGLLTVVALLANPIRVRGPALGPGPTLGVPDFGSSGGDGQGPASRDLGGTSVIRGQELEPAEGDDVVRLDDEVAAHPLAERMRRLLGPLLLLVIGLLVMRMLVRARASDDVAEIVRQPDESDPGGDHPSGVIEGFAGPSGPFGDDPHGRIVSAYRRLLVALGEVGLGRRREEGPHEHVRRATVAEPGAAPLHQLAGLYVLAEFGGTELSERHGGAAEQALADGLQWLGGRRGRSP